MRAQTDRRATVANRVAWVAWGTALLLLAAAMVLASRNGSFSEDPLSVLSLGVFAAYTTVGAILASRLPSNPLGWFFLSVGAGILIGGFAAEYATFTLRTSRGSLPFGTAAAWLQNWVFPLAIVAVPLLFLLFPTGHVPSRRWRWVPAALIASIGALVLASMVAPGPIDVSEGVRPMNPLGIEALDGVTNATDWISGLSLGGLSVASAVALVVRFRRSRGDERQQLRWLAAVGALTAFALLLVLLTAIGVGPNETRPINDFAFLLLFVSFGFGLPLAALLALLKYRLYDLDLVIKKTLVAGVVVVLLAAVGLLVLALVGSLVVGPVSEEPAALGVAGLAVGLLFLPMLRLARRLADRMVYGRRATPYEVLTEFSGRVAEAYSIEDVLPRMAAVLAAGTGAERATVWLRVGRDLRPVAAWPTDKARAEPVAVVRDELPPFEGADAFEVRHQSELLGAVTVTMPANDPMNPSKERLIRDLASQGGLVLRNVGLIEELRASRQRLVAAQDEERRKLERNIHDGAQQGLVALSIKLRLLEQLARKDPDSTAEMAAELQSDATGALENLRDLARGIYPPLLADQGLEAALEAQARKAAVPTSVDADSLGRYSQEVEATVYFSVLEALQNVAKYAEASRARVSLADGDGFVTFTVTDDGHGFDASATRYGTGLQGMADRLEAIGGSLEIESEPGRGTMITGRIPLRATG